MESNWNTARGRGRASRIAQRGNVRRGVSSRLNPDSRQGENQRGRNFRGQPSNRGGFPGGLPTFLSFLSNIVPGQEAADPEQGGPRHGGQRGRPGQYPRGYVHQGYQGSGPRRSQNEGPGSRRPQEQDQARRDEPRDQGKGPRRNETNGPQRDMSTGVASQLAMSLKALQDGLNAIQQQFNAWTNNNMDTLTATSGERRNADTQGQGQGTQEQGQGNTRVEETKSGNVDFSDLCKNTFRYVQVSHHIENWQNLPNSIGKNISTLVSNIKPPMPNIELTDKLTAIGIDFGNKIAETVKSHLLNAKVNVESSLLRLDNQDVDKAHTIVKKQLEYKLGRKMSAKNQESWLTQAKGLVDVEKSTNDANQPVQNSEASRTTTNKTYASTTMLGSAKKRKLELEKSPKPGTSKAIDFCTSLDSSDEGGCSADIEEFSDLDNTIVAISDTPKCSQSKITTRSKSNVTVHSKPFNIRIAIKPSCKVLVVGDSQLQNLKLPDQFQIESFRGAAFPHLTEVIKTAELTDQVEDIILSAGVNHRDKNLEKEMMPTLKTCISALRQTGKRIHFLEVSIPNSFTELQRSRMEALNEYIRGQGQDLSYIGSCPREKVTTLADGLHYGKSTLSIIAGKITNHFLN